MKSAGRLLFGTAGVPNRAKDGGSTGGIECLRSLGLDAMEIEYVRGSFPSETTARAIETCASQNGIGLTAHAPYFINLNAAEAGKLEASRKRIVDTAYYGNMSGAVSIVFHAGFYLGGDRNTVYDRIASELAGIVDEVRGMGIGVDIRPELTGKESQFGSLEGILRLSRDIDGVMPCIDWAHLHARRGGNNTEGEFRTVLDSVRDMLGDTALKRLHMHLSGIEYGPKGERKHRNLDESDFNYRDLLKVLKTEGAAGFLVCESPSLENDALLLKDYYESL